jgi:HK97 family phage prohead protease
MTHRRRSNDQMLHRFVGSGVVALSEYEIDVTICTSTNAALDGDVWDMEGIDLSRFLIHPIVLWDHDMGQPIGRASNLKVTPEKITARVTFPEQGVSPKADEVRKLVKAGIVTAVSAGIMPTRTKPLNQADPRGGKRVAESILLEFSIVAVPSDAESGVTARSNGGNTVTETTDAEIAATAEVAKHRGAARKRALAVRPRGLYSVAQTAYLLDGLGWQVDMAKWEAEVENDASKVPAMLASVMHDLADALIAMTIEEVGELLAGHDVEIEDPLDGELDAEERAAIAGAATPALRAFRRGMAHAKKRAGKKLSADTVRCLRDALDAHGQATTDIRSALARQKSALGTIDEMIVDVDEADENGDADSGEADDNEATEERALRAQALQLKAKAHARQG